jgi:hypothetical protein
LAFHFIYIEPVKMKSWTRLLFSFLIV